MNLNIIDMRLGGTPPGDTSFSVVMTVDQNTPIHDLITRVRVHCLAYDSKLEILRIQAHGNHSYLQLCKEGLGSWTAITEFGRLKGFFHYGGLIALYGCRVVWDGTSMMMSDLARACRAYVLGSANQEMYSEKPTIDWGSWEGHLYLCTPAGKWYCLGGKSRRRRLTYREFVMGRADNYGSYSDLLDIPRILRWRLWSAMFPEGRSREWMAGVDSWQF